MKIKAKGLLVALAILGLTPFAAQAGTITLGGPLPGAREASLTDAISGFAGTGNATVTDVNGHYGGTWTELAECAGGDPCNDGVLTINLLTGSWGGAPASGTWSISSLFSYLDLAVSIHVGNGGGNPDYFVWLIANNGVPGGPYSGTWEYDGGSTGGGGLSNFKAYGRTPGTLTVPDGGATIGLVGLAMLGLGYLRRRIS